MFNYKKCETTDLQHKNYRFYWEITVFYLQDSSFASYHVGSSELVYQSLNYIYTENIGFWKLVPVTLRSFWLHYKAISNNPSMGGVSGNTPLQSH